MTLRLRLLLLGALLVVGVGAGLAVSQALRAASPPQLYIDAPHQTPVGLPLPILLSASKPVSYTLVYGELTMSEVAQDWQPEIEALAGRQEVRVMAEDAAGNRVEERFVVYGIPAPQPMIRTGTRERIPGEPVSVSVVWAPADLTLTELEITLAGEPLTVYRTAEEAVALGSVPLGSEPSEWVIGVRLVDGFGREVTATRTLVVLEDPREVQTLHVSPEVLAVSTPQARQLEEQAMAEAYASSQHTSAPLWREPFVLPAQGRFTSPYGQPRRYAAGGNVSYHHGTDIAAPEGTPIVASNDGVVMVADFFPIKGGLVVIDHGATVYSLYFHQSRILVQKGERVRRGEVIGEVGTTGLSTGPHLHWEMRVNTVSTNPMSWVDQVLP